MMEADLDYTRKYARIKAPFKVKIITYNHKRLDSDYCTCAEGLDISPNGLSFKYPNVLEKDDHMNIVIEDVPGLDESGIKASVRVIWAEAKDILSKRFGGKFLRICPTKKVKLMKLTKKKGEEDEE